MVDLGFLKVTSGLLRTLRVYHGFLKVDPTLKLDYVSLELNTLLSSQIRNQDTEQSKADGL